jgi:hypothetical protein
MPKSAELGVRNRFDRPYVGIGAPRFHFESDKRIARWIAAHDIELAITTSPICGQNIDSASG